jgi:DNA processing protein
MQEREAWLALNLVPHVGPATFALLLEHFGTAKRALKAPLRELQEISGVGGATAEAIRSFPAEEVLRRELEVMEREGAHFLTLKDPEYPAPLRHIPHPPPVLCARGEWIESDQKAVAIVGSRNASPYGLGVAERLASELAVRGITIVSGMARGIDAAAHRGALKAGGRTIAVFGSGLDVMYPKEHRRLAKEIGGAGALFSEFPFGTQPLQSNFPQRNRLISGLSLGVVVVEAALDSGALITAHYALEQGREVFAVPGPIAHRLSRGCHRLIKEGAKLTESWEDVLEELKVHPLPATEVPSFVTTLPPVEGEEERVLQVLGEEPLHIDTIIAGSGLSAGAVAASLLSLEMKGWIKQLSGKAFVRVGEG